MKLDIRNITHTVSEAASKAAAGLCKLGALIREKRDAEVNGDPLMLTVKASGSAKLVRKSNSAEMATDAKTCDFSVHVVDLAIVLGTLSLVMPLIKSLWAISDKIVRKLD